MRYFILTTLALLSFTGSAHAMQDMAKIAACDITVSFGSAGSGPDEDIGMTMKTYLDGDKDRLKYTRQNRGVEGEFNYCIMVKDAVDSKSIYRNLKSILPVAQMGAAPVMIKARHQNAKQVAPVIAVPPIPEDL
jgi:hypothetical protein